MSTKRIGTFTESGNSGVTGAPGVHVAGPLNLSIWGTFEATVTLQRSFDGGSTWLTCSLDAQGTPAVFTGAVELRIDDAEPGTLYRLSCVWASGTVNYRFGG